MVRFQTALKNMSWDVKNELRRCGGQRGTDTGSSASAGVCCFMSFWLLASRNSWWSFTQNFSRCLIKVVVLNDATSLPALGTPALRTLQVAVLHFTFSPHWSYCWRFATRGLRTCGASTVQRPNCRMEFGRWSGSAPSVRYPMNNSHQNQTWYLRLIIP